MVNEERNNLSINVTRRHWNNSEKHAVWDFAISIKNKEDITIEKIKEIINKSNSKYQEEEKKKIQKKEIDIRPRSVKAIIIKIIE